MKIDYIYGNPPYDGDLHLNILRVCKQIASQISWLHPARWIQAINRKRYSFLDNSIETIDFIAEDTKELFCGMDISGNLIISDIRKGIKGKSVKDINPLTLRPVFSNPDLCMSIFKKIMKKADKTIKDVLIIDKPLKKYSVIFSIMSGNGGSKNADISKLVTNNQNCIYKNGIAPDGKTFAERRSKGSPPKDFAEHVEFNTEKEAESFLISLKTEIYIFINSISHVDIHVHPDLIPFMSEYNTVWDEQTLARYFELTNDEVKEIETVISSYFPEYQSQ